MCGRFTRYLTWREIYELYRLTAPQAALNIPARSDIRPTTDIVIVRERDGLREAANVCWSLVLPFWKELSSKYSMHNARAESLAEKPSFREPLKHRRCLIPASGFYEWKTEGEGRKAKKTRFYITTKSGAPLTFAGLWESNSQINIESCTMICCGPNELMAPIHDRMPVILAPQHLDAWLAEPRVDLLRPAPVEDLIAYPVRSDIRDEDPPETLSPTVGMSAAGE